MRPSTVRICLPKKDPWGNSKLEDIDLEITVRSGFSPITDDDISDLYWSLFDVGYYVPDKFEVTYIELPNTGFILEPSDKSFERCTFKLSHPDLVNKLGYTPKYNIVIKTQIDHGFELIIDCGIADGILTSSVCFTVPAVSARGELLPEKEYTSITAKEIELSDALRLPQVLDKIPGNRYVISENYEYLDVIYLGTIKANSNILIQISRSFRTPTTHISAHPVYCLEECNYDNFIIRRNLQNPTNIIEPSEVDIEVFIKYSDEFIGKTLEESLKSSVVSNTYLTCIQTPATRSIPLTLNKYAIRDINTNLKVPAHLIKEGILKIKDDSSNDFDSIFKDFILKKRISFLETNSQSPAIMFDPFRYASLFLDVNANVGEGDELEENYLRSFDWIIGRDIRYINLYKPTCLSTREVLNLPWAQKLTGIKILNSIKNLNFKNKILKEYELHSI